jgi:hypothetical protein
MGTAGGDGGDGGAPGGLPGADGTPGGLPGGGLDGGGGADGGDGWLHALGASPKGITGARAAKWWSVGVAQRPRRT